MKTLWVLGAGGHAKVVIATARAAGFESIRVADDNDGRIGSTILGTTVEKSTRPILDDPDALAILGVGDNRARLRLGSSAKCTFATLIHPSAIVDASVVIGEGSVVFAGAVIQPDSRLGRHVIVNTHASIDHDGVIGDAVHIAPGVHLSGTVTLGEGVLVGVGAAISPNRTVGAWTVVGAGAVVVHDLPKDVVAIGVPARPR